MSSGGADKDRKRPGEIMSSKGIKQSTTRSGMLAQRLKTTGNLGKGNEKSIISTRSDLDEVTTAILNAAKGKIQEATKVSKDRLKRLGPNTSRGVEGDFYIDRVTGKRVKDISMDADDEGEVMSVMFPQPDAKPIFRQEENNTDVVMPRSYTKMDDDDVKSLHFGELTTVQGSEKDMPSGKRRGRGLKKKLIRNIM